MNDTELESKANAGDTDAQCSLAFLFEIGLDRPQDLTQAVHYWQMAAQLGKQLAIDKLKFLISQGRVQADVLPQVITDPGPKPTPLNTDLKPSPIGAVKILLADDEDELRELMGDYLVAAGFRVIMAINGEEAVQKILAHPDIKVIVTDLKMPKLNGLQFIKTIRRMQVAEDAKVVIMTAYSQTSLINEGKRLNVDTWLVKPIRPQVMIDTLKKLTQRKEQVA